ncbi:hypothetical protein BGX24_008394 [Mortierella sp. AD032]|nr:hypothetical protein BGX24_008394 [Mortierella sp. AD032]
MVTTRWSSRYEMMKRAFKMKVHIAAIVKHFTDNPPRSGGKKANKYGNETGASTIPTVSTIAETQLNLNGTFTPVTAGKLDEYNKQMEVFDIINRQLNDLVAMNMFLDPNLINDKL